eukprot:gnl/TRDRNA2_/TRDRNA2_87244_c0_seq1.p1 gnl/TRDRNA2_/TRDRNA2_87244_c0~~gnl/TRDRNA2_/TRDRNA2_87244_c0_seq1.p1  ORF type:complete len:399 (+),score=59.50 gnl/TRDRNA2_/TRDRNA2_87244_c0_seq1:90-1286(+)
MKRYSLCQCLTRADQSVPQTPIPDIASARPLQNVVEGPWCHVEPPGDPDLLFEQAVNRPGCTLTAARHLANAEASGFDPLDIIDESRVKALWRWTARFQELIGISRPDTTQPGWRKGSNAEIGMSFAYCIIDDHMEALCMKDFNDIDAVNAIVGYSESHFRARHVVGTEEVTVMAQSQDAALWKQLTAFDDHIMQVELVNALDESLGTIVHLITSVTTSSEIFPDIAIPAKTRELRPEDYVQVVEFEPLPASHSCRARYGFRMQMPERMKAFVGSSNPNLVDKAMRSALSIWPRDFEQFQHDYRYDILCREVSSPHAAFYSLCRASLSRRTLGLGRRSPSAAAAEIRSFEQGVEEEEEGPKAEDAYFSFRTAKPPPTRDREKAEDEQSFVGWFFSGLL